MRNRGQALVEFVIILPILIILLLGVIDFGNILYKKYTLENDLDYVTELVKQDKMVEAKYYLDQQDVVLHIENKNSTTSIILTKKVSVMTPGLNRVLGKNYQIEASRVIANES